MQKKMAASSETRVSSLVTSGLRWFCGTMVVISASDCTQESGILSFPKMKQFKYLGVSVCCSRYTSQSIFQLPSVFLSFGYTMVWVNSQFWLAAGCQLKCDIQMPTELIK